ncbi:MAG TPA: hypothetical protein VK212_03460 [Lentimicrobium sp.]|nr:hypothetical protein [Lentimicrobium sp.]
MKRNLFFFVLTTILVGCSHKTYEASGLYVSENNKRRSVTYSHSLRIYDDKTFLYSKSVNGQATGDCSGWWEKISADSICLICDTMDANPFNFFNYLKFGATHYNAKILNNNTILIRSHMYKKVNNDLYQLDLNRRNEILHKRDSLNRIQRIDSVY